MTGTSRACCSNRRPPALMSTFADTDTTDTCTEEACQACRKTRSSTLAGQRQTRAARFFAHRGVRQPVHPRHTPRQLPQDHVGRGVGLDLIHREHVVRPRVRQAVAILRKREDMSRAAQPA